MKRIAPICLLAMAYMASEPTWAACSDSKVDVALVTTVTVIAGPYDTCIWTDNNVGNSRTLSVAGVVVPNLLQPSNVEFLAYSTVLTATNQTDLYDAKCETTGLVCSEWGLETPDIGMPRARACVVYNRAAALTATATCVFERPAL